MKTRKIPLRKCIACGDGKAKKELLRVVKNKESVVSVDQTGRANGRGAYICSNLQCLKLAEKNRKLNSALKAEIPKEIYEDLKAIIEYKMEE